MVSAIIFKAVAAIALGLVGIYYFRNAEKLCQQFGKRADTVSKRFRFLYPDWFYKTGLCVLQMRLAAVVALFMSVVFVVLVFISLFAR